MLTKKQRDLLIFIHERMADGDLAPSFDEMKDALDLKSKSGIHRLIEALVERGFLERLPNRARALQVRKLPEGYAPKPADHSEVAQKARMVQDLSSYRARAQERAAIASIPLLGKIAAGTPIEAIRHDGQTIDMPASMIGKGEYYALVVDGDSMKDAGIMDQDVALIKKSDHAHDGDIVVALVDEQEVTLKRLRRRGSHIDLIPENPAYDIRTFEGGRVQVQGVLSGLYRQYH
ncbi:MAG: transcriptional repressor LexA [Alphaproteobacteria bacterium]|nr:transcriptional repressor LexA [Alphaproteobacteria bacterium]USO07760.1 MAG: transcriptional repressor LexA [Rhodospirillales bacterium]